VLLKVTEALTVEEITERVGEVSKGAIRHHLNKLCDQGKISFKPGDSAFGGGLYFPVLINASDLLCNKWDASLELGEMA
jgi:hypothetical protein